MIRVRPWDAPPPGLELDGFMETHETFLARMRERVGTYCPSGQEEAPLRGIAGKNDDPAMMLFDAWAAVLDVLSFYQRRLLAEGYVATAVHARSVHELARAVAVDVQPATSASVDVCFTVSDKQPGLVKVPKGTSLQSVPASGGGYLRAPSRTDVAPPLVVPLTPTTTDPGATPQVFETMTDLSARADWNQMALARAPDADGSAVTGDAVGLLVKGGSYGVQAGDALLFATRTPAGDLGFGTLRTVQRIGRARARGCTLFLWSPDAPLDPDRGPAPIAGLEVFTCRAPEPLYGSDAPAWSQLPLAQRAQYRAMVGGLQSCDGAGAEGGPWRNVEQPAPAGYPDVGRTPVGRVLCLAVDPGGALLASVEGQGLLRRTDLASGWQPTQGIASRSDVLCLARDEAGRLYAGTSRGVFRSADQGQTWDPITGGGVSPTSTPPPQFALYRLPPTPVRAIAILAGAAGAAVIAGTDDGVFRWDYVGAVWPALNQGLPSSSATVATARASIAMRAVVVDPAAKLLYAGTPRGLFVCPTGDLDKAVWRPCDDASASFDVAAIAVGAGGVVYAGLAARGGLRVRGTSGAWTQVGGALADVTVRAVAVAVDTPDAAVFVATDQGVFRSSDGGQTWKPLGTGLSNPDVTALALSPDGAVIVATPFVAVAAVADAAGTDDDWPAWPLAKGSIDLARTTTRVAPGDTVALVQDGAAATEPVSLVLEVRGVATITRDGFGHRRQVTTLAVGDADLSRFDRRLARVRFAGTQIPLFDRQVRSISAVEAKGATLDEHLADDDDFTKLTQGEAVVQPAPANELDLEGVVPDLGGRRVVVVGKSLRARVGAAMQLQPDDGRVQPVQLAAGEVVALRAQVSAPGVLGLPTWRISVRQRVDATLATTPDLTLLPAADDDDDVAQVRTVTASRVTSLSTGLPASVATPVTRITLDAPLTGVLDPATVTVCANVVTATHGRTVTPQEVLGSADGSANLELTLKNKPLTWTGPDGARAPKLHVWVAKHRWTWVESFAEAGRDDRVFLVKTTSDGASVVCFGDGVRGSRPPAEAEIVADYRYGAGTAGNVGAGRITMIRQRPLGLTAVVNPLAATGGTDAEPADDLRGRAPIVVRALDRIVSVRDCEDVVSVFPGIARASAGRVWNGRRDVIFVTVATADATAGYQLAKGSAVYGALMKKLQAVDGVVVESCVVTYFDVAVALIVDADAAGMEAQARDALLAGLGFDARDLRQDVAVSQVVAILVAIPGVRDARVRLATRDGRHADGAVAVLAASDAHLVESARAVVPAELLLVNAALGGILVDVEVGT